MTALRHDERPVQGRYCDMIVDSLLGRTPGLSAIPPERLDWWGHEAVLRLFNQTAGAEREAFIEALGQITEDEEQPEVLAQVVFLVSGLDLAQLEPRVARLRDRPVAQVDPIRAAVADYFAYRAMRRGEVVHADQVGG